MALSHGRGESVTLFFESLRVGTDVEGRLQIVLVRRVLVETTHEVGDGGREVVAPGNWRVQQNTLTCLRDGERFGIRHPFEHFDVDLSFDSP